MGWETLYDKEERAKCACGKGFVVRRVYEKGDDWGRYTSGSYDYSIQCEYCAKHYKIESDSHTRLHPKYGYCTDTTHYLVPVEKTLNIQTEPKPLPFEGHAPFEHKAVAIYTKEELVSAVEDMKVSKYSTRLSLEISRDLTSIYYKEKKSKNLCNIIEALEKCIDEYESFTWNYWKVKSFREDELQRLEENRNEKKCVLADSIVLNFEN